MKVAVVHYWLVGMRGGERVLEEILSLFPQAVIVTHVCDRPKLSKRILQHEIRETFISKLPFAKRKYQTYLPFMPLALEQMDMTEFDLVISSESGPAKGIICRPDAIHICYCHSPMRYIWDQMHVYRANASRLTRWLMPIVSHKLRVWDVTSAARVDHFIANSNYVSQRIEKFYRRSSDVLYPPVATDEFSTAHKSQIGSHYLMAGELVAYKRPDLAIEAFNKSGRSLTVVGEGNMRKTLEQKSGSNITFLGKVPFAELKHHFATCRALIFPGEEDFGIVPVEVMASGRPVVAFGRGGALDTIKEGETGMFFQGQTVSVLNKALDKFETQLLPKVDGTQLRAHAEQFSRERFRLGLIECLVKSGVLVDSIALTNDSSEIS